MPQDQAGFTPVLYVKKDCSHCLKVRLFLLEAGLMEEFDVREFAPGDEREEAMRAELAPHFETMTFPALQFAPGRFMQDSDAIIARIAGERGVDRAALPAFVSYAHGVLPKLQAARKELKALKEQAVNS